MEKLSKTEKRLMNVIDIKIDGVIFGIKKVTPEDFLDKQGLPISKWQMESAAFFTKKRDDNLSLTELKKDWKRLFLKSIVYIDNDTDNLVELIDKLMGNYSMCMVLQNDIVLHAMGSKKKRWILNI